MIDHCSVRLSHDYAVELWSWNVQCNSCVYKKKKIRDEMKVICIDLQNNVVDPFYEEENFWFVQ